MLKRLERLLFPVLVLAAGALLWPLARAEERKEIEIAGYATSLRERTPSQRYNARKAVQAIDGRRIAPGETFSFNRVVKSWSWDQGYVKAPVSYDGELVKAYGGGVCQTSTTLYNAALLAGLPIIERHHHVFAPHYVPPGRDAAVAQRNIDLQFRNPYSWPIRIRATARNDKLDIRIFGLEQPQTQIAIEARVLAEQDPVRLTRVVFRPIERAGRTYVRNPGATGYRVVTYRTFTQAGREVRSERLSDDSYQAMNRVIQVNEAE